MGDAVRGIVGLGRLNVPEGQPEMLRLFDGIKVEQKQRSIQLNVQIPADLVDSLLKATNPRPKVELKIILMLAACCEWSRHLSRVFCPNVAATI
jgi:hypothetical protein